jgi:hypothetical protein
MRGPVNVAWALRGFPSSGNRPERAMCAKKTCPEWGRDTFICGTDDPDDLPPQLRANGKGVCTGTRRHPGKAKDIDYLMELGSLLRFFRLLGLFCAVLLARGMGVLKNSCCVKYRLRCFVSLCR